MKKIKGLEIMSKNLIAFKINKENQLKQQHSKEKEVRN